MALDADDILVAHKIGEVHALLSCLTRPCSCCDGLFISTGDAGTHQGALEPIGSGTGSAALQGFGSARTADSGLPDTPMSAAGNQDPRLLQQVCAALFPRGKLELAQQAATP